MTVIDYIKSHITVLDGGMGTMLQKNGLQTGIAPEQLNLSEPALITDIHKAYFDAGANIVNTNTFGVYTLKYDSDTVEKMIAAAVENAKKAALLSHSTKQKFVALDIGPLGKMLKPLGDLDFEKAVEIFAQTVRYGVKYGVDLIFIETFTDLYEAKAAVLAAKENSDLPVFVSCAYAEDKKLLTGANPLAVIATLEGLGVDALGVNCSYGPDRLIPVIEDYLQYASVPVIFKPNAGLPDVINGQTVYDITPCDFAKTVAKTVENGVLLVGGCCGTTPEHITLLNESIKNLKPLAVQKKQETVVCSYTHGVTIGSSPVIIGERINPTGKKAFREALINGDMPYVLQEGISQQEAGADILDVNVGVPGINEAQVLSKTVTELQGILDTPLQIDTSDACALERALRLYNGKALINSVNGKQDSMKTVFGLAKKYGGVVVALTLDENGIPETPEGRLQIAQNILKTAEAYGIDRKDLIFDTLVMAVSADKNAGKTTLQALKLIKEKTGCKTVLGVSNISFGLPERPILNAAFLLTALNTGLNAAIVNPLLPAIKNTFLCYNALNGSDMNFESYIGSVAGQNEAPTVPTDINIKTAVIKGLKENASLLTKELLKTAEPLNIIESELIPALDKVGKDYESKKAYLPQLLMSAEAAKAAFDEIKKVVQKQNTADNPTKPIVLATVKGDVHDIGKNIVKLLLENYGFCVIDLGKDVPAQTILNAVIKHNAGVCGLSALMTTTVPFMEETVKLIKEKAPSCKTVVGGAVLNQDFATQIKADYYACDAMATVRIAQQLLKGK